MLTGDGDIVDVQAVAEYQVADTPDAVQKFLYHVANPGAVVRTVAIGALQQAVSERPIDSLLTIARPDVESEVKTQLMQPALDAYGSGIRVVGFKITSMHAPSPVHDAFRDVASAAEDAATSVNRGREYAERVVRQAEGDSSRDVDVARGNAADRVAVARGEATSFLAKSAAYRSAPTLTRSWMYMEKLETVLPRLDLYVDLTSTAGKGPSLWINRTTGTGTAPGASPASSTSTATGSPPSSQQEEGNQP